MERESEWVPGRVTRFRVPSDALDNRVSTADLARLIQQLRAGFNVRSRS